MTIDFATLEEAWGQPFIQSPAAANKKPKKKSKTKFEPICALTNPAELEDVMEEYYYSEEPYDKNAFSRTQLPQEDTEAPVREPAQSVKISNVEIDGSSAVASKETKTQTASPVPKVATTQSPNAMPDTNQVMEMIIYISSGILLIFMMEQFIQLGVQLKS